MKKTTSKIRRLRGWSTRGRPFSPREFRTSHLKKNTKTSYSKYLKSYANQYKNPKLRRSL